jgi:hypothetical protein
MNPHTVTDLPDDTQRRLRELRDHYTFQVNVAIEEGREHEINSLVAGYPDDAARLLEHAARHAA